MNIPAARAPVSLLLDPLLSPAARLVWMALQLHAQGLIDTSGAPGTVSAPGPAGAARPARPPGPAGHTGAVPAVPADSARIASLSGLVRPTILRVLPRLAAAGWCTLTPGNQATAIDRAAGDARVQVPAALLADQRVGIRAKLLYGVLQRVPGFGYRRDQPRPGGRPPSGGQFTYAALSDLARTSRNAMKRAVHDLTQCGWLQVEQKNRLAPLCFALRNPIVERGEGEVARAQERLTNAEHYGEGLMRELLWLLIHSENFADDAAPGFMENPLTHQRLELDRYYPPGVAFEFNGPQHYGTTDLYTSAEADQQRVRDLIKLGICVTRGIRLVVVHAEDLSLAGMREKVGDLLPLRDLNQHAALVEFLESEARAYRWKAKSGKFSAPVRPAHRLKAAT